MKKANMVLGVFMLLSCCVSAFCLSVMSYTLVTGELPFDIKPLMPDVEIHNKDPKKEAKEAVKKENRKLRFGEEHVMALYKDLEEERKKLDERRKNLEDLKKTIDAEKADVLAIQDKLRDEMTVLRKKLEKIDQQEIANIKERAATLAEIEPKQAGELIKRWEDDWKNKTPEEKKLANRMAPRVLFFMSTKDRSAVEGALLKENNPITTGMVAEISEAMKNLYPELQKEK